MIDNEMVTRLADAARIELAPEEVTRLAAQLSDILEQIAVLASVPAGAAQAKTQHSDAQPLRADEVAPDKLHGTLNRFAPEVRDGFFTVPLLPTHRQDVTP